MEISPRRECLLIAQVLIGGYEQLKTIGFGCIQKLPVIKVAPAALKSSLNRVMTQRTAQWDGSALVE